MDIKSLVSNCIENFNLLNNKNSIIVAYSGGRDSLSLCKVLSSLGYNLKPVIIDIGYNVDWTCAIKNLQNIGLSCDVVNIEFISKYLKNTYSKVVEYFNKVCEINLKNQDTLTTICTPCYNAKYIILCELSKLYNIDNVAFGHHGTDAVASFLKSYFMYIDRWEWSHSVFNINNIYKVIDNSKCYFDNKESFDNMLYKKFQNLILDKKISTDEPPLSVVDHGVRFIRPMFYCVEKKVKEYVFPDEYDYVKSECEFIIRKNKILTSREYIQQNILNDTLNEEVYNCLISLICNGLKSNGEVVYDVRRNRDFILGKEYKNDGICQKL